jgi:signal recognition particle subunit SRP54
MKIVQDGIERFTKDRFDLIIVDTSGRHKQEASLFTEMWELAEVAVRYSNYDSP